MNKPHEPPLKLLKILTVKRNIADPAQLPDFEDDIASYSSGYKGELSIDHDLNYILDDHFRLHNLRLPIKQWHFEIDTLIVSEHFLLILEIKNHKDIITIDHEAGIMYQHTNGEEKKYQDPVTQVEKQARQLEYFLREKGYTVPIESLVVFVNKNVHLKDNRHPRVIYPYRLSHKYYEFYEQLKHLPALQTQDISRILIQASERQEIDILKEFNLQVCDFLPGCFCENCCKKSIKKVGYTWKCELCHMKDKDAPYRALKEHYLLFGPEITAAQASYWLQISVKSAGYLLDRYGFEKVGEKRGTKYIMVFDHAKDFEFILQYNDQLYKKKLDEGFRD